MKVLVPFERALGQVRFIETHERGYICHVRSYRWTHYQGRHGIRGKLSKTPSKTSNLVTSTLYTWSNSTPQIPSEVNIYKTRRPRAARQQVTNKSMLKKTIMAKNDLEAHLLQTFHPPLLLEAQLRTSQLHLPNYTFHLTTTRGIDIHSLTHA